MAHDMIATNLRVNRPCPLAPWPHPNISRRQPRVRAAVDSVVHSEHRCAARAPPFVVPTLSAKEIHTDTSILFDLFWCGVVFVAAWVIFFAAYVVAARLRWIKGLDPRLVLMACLSAVTAAGLSWLFLGHCFSSPNALWLATVTAPLAFLGFCGLFILTGPANVDRSITVSILTAVSTLETQDGAIEKLKAAVPFDRILEKRIREMSAYGAIELNAGRVRLTSSGNRTRRFFLWLGRQLNITPQ